MIEDKIGYKFNNPKLLKQALTHPSAKRNKITQDYERLEFLGDSILGMIVSEILFKRFGGENEGKLAKRKAATVCKESLAHIARELSIGKYMILGTGEDQIGGRENKANLENVLEALVAAIYLDGGLEKTRAFVDRFFSDIIEKMATPPKDPKSSLQEWAQARGMALPKYTVVSMEGPSHEPIIEVELTVDKYSEKASASSRKEAERKASEKLLQTIEKNNDKKPGKKN